jgi:excisionase family DNA binding protein
MSTPARISETPQRVSLIVAAGALGCSTKTVRRYIAEGRLTGYRMGPRLIRIDLNEIDALLSPIPTVQAS